MALGAGGAQLSPVLCRRPSFPGAVYQRTLEPTLKRSTHVTLCEKPTEQNPE